MRSTYLSEAKDEQEFALKAAKAFANNPALATFTEGDIKPDAYLAIRWGLGRDCVVVVKLDSVHQPINYMEIVNQFNAL